MSDDRHDGDGAIFRPLVLSPDEERQIRNLIGVGERLEKFTDAEKQALGTLIKDQPDLHEMVEGRRRWTAFKKGALWFLTYLGGLLAGIVALNELVGNFLKLRGMR